MSQDRTRACWSSGEKFEPAPLLPSYGAASRFSNASSRLAAPKREQRRVAETEGFERFVIALDFASQITE